MLKIDVKKVAEELRAGVANETSQHRKKQMLKRLKIVDAILINIAGIKSPYTSFNFYLIITKCL